MKNETYSKRSHKAWLTAIEEHIRTECTKFIAAGGILETGSHVDLENGGWSSTCRCALEVCCTGPEPNIDSNELEFPDKAAAIMLRMTEIEFEAFTRGFDDDDFRPETYSTVALTRSRLQQLKALGSKLREDFNAREQEPYTIGKFLRER